MGQDEALLEWSPAPTSPAATTRAIPPPCCARSAAVARGVAAGGASRAARPAGFRPADMAVSPEEARGWPSTRWGPCTPSPGPPAPAWATQGPWRALNHGGRIAPGRGLAAAVRDFDPALILVGLRQRADPGGAAAGLCASEVFADRGWSPTAASPPGPAGRHDRGRGLAVARVLRMVLEGKVAGRDGADVESRPTPCASTATSPRP